MDSLTSLHSLHFTSLHFTHSRLTFVVSTPYGLPQASTTSWKGVDAALKARVHTALVLAPSPSPSCPTLRGFGTERARLGTFRGFETERARLGTLRGFGTERARLGTFRGLKNLRFFLPKKPPLLKFEDGFLST